MPLAGDAVGTYMIPRPVLELLQQPGLLRAQSGICAESGFCWILAGQHLYIWRYKEGKDARLRVLTLPRAPPGPDNPSYVSIVGHDGSASVAVCTPDGHLTVWLDANHLAYPSEQQLLAPSAAGASGQAPARLVTAFTASHLPLGGGPAFLAALGTVDGSWYLVQAGPQGIFAKQLGAPSGGAESRGLVGALGSALSKVYTDAFDPSAKYLRRSHTQRPALGVALAPTPGGGGQHFRVLLLTDESVDCWTLTIGLRPSEALQWSFLNTALSTRDTRRAVSASNLAMAVCGSHLAVWIAERSKAGNVAHVVQLLEITADGTPAVMSGAQEALEGYREPHAASPRRQLLYEAGHGSCLLADWAPSCCSLWAWNSHTGVAECVSEDPDTAAVALSSAPAAAAGPCWVMLSATYGVVEVAVAASGAAPPAAGGASGASAAPLDPAAAACHLLDALLGQADSIAAAGGNLQPLVAGLERRLLGLGVLGSAAGQQVLSAYSSQLVDMLPKQWTGTGGEGAAAAATGASASLPEQLADKEARHGLLLQCLALSGVLPMLTPEVLRVLMEGSERLAVASALLRHQMQLEGVAGGPADASAPNAATTSAAALSLLKQLVEEAGRRSVVGSYEVLGTTEVFYSRPSISIGHWMDAVRGAAAAVQQQAAGGLATPGDRGASELRAVARELCSLVQLAVGAAMSRREGLQRSFRLAAGEVAARLGSPDWLAAQPAREAEDQLAQALQALRPRPGSESSQSSAELSYSLLGVSDLVLAAFANAVAALREAPAARAAVLSQYRTVRDRCCDDLLADALEEIAQATAADGGAAGAGPAGSAALLGQDLLIWHVEQLAVAHHCYRQLFDACEAFSRLDPAAYGSRLHTYMATLPAEEGAAPGATFAVYVYGRLLSEGRHADLLDLPRHFHAGITSFLQSHSQPDLLWLHLMRTGALADAAAVLTQRAAAAGGDGLDSSKRLLSLGRLAARAGAAAQLEDAAVVQLRLLAVQERLGLGSGPPLEAAVLLDRALAMAASGQNGAAAAAAVEVLAIVPPEVHKAHATKWQRAWRAVYDSDPWAALEEQRHNAAAVLGGGAATGGWPAALASTATCAAAVACRGSEALGMGASVSDTAPTDQVAGWLRKWAAESGGRERREEVVLAAFRMGLEGGTGSPAAVHAGLEADDMVM